MNLEQLRAMLNADNKRMAEILKLAKDEKRDMSEAEQTEFDTLFEKAETTEDEIVSLEDKARKVEKVAARTRHLSTATTQAILPAIETPNEDSPDEYREAFWKEQKREHLTHDEVRVLNTGVGEKGGYLVPESFADQIILKTTEKSYIRDLATVSTSSSLENLPVEGDDGANGWIDEGGEYPESDPSLDKITLGAHKTGRIIKVTEEVLEDSAPKIEAYVVMKFTKSTVKAEEAAFINGDGISKPTGLLVDAEVGKTTATATTLDADEILDLEYALDEDYLLNARWMMNRKTLKSIRKMKDANGQYLWAPGFDGQPATFDGFPIRVNKHMPDIAAGAKPLVFGDISYYHIKDRTVMNMKRLDELYAKTGHIGFRIDKRVDGKLVLAEAVQALQMAA